MDMKERVKESLGEKILDWQEHSAKRIYFLIDKKDIVEITRLLVNDLGLRFAITTGVDAPAGFEMLYHFSYDATGEYYSVRTFIKDKDKPEIDSITPLFPGAEWIEREIWELLGINFKNHPNLKRLLLADDWPEGDYPLRNK